MKTTLIQMASFALLAGAIAFAPVHAGAQTTTNVPAAPKPEKGDVMRFHGIIKAVDPAKETIEVSGHEYVVIPKSKLVMNKKEANIYDAKVGDHAGGMYKLVDNRRLIISITFSKERPGEDPGAPASATPPAAPQGDTK